MHIGIALKHWNFEYSYKLNEFLTVTIASYLKPIASFMHNHIKLPLLAF